MIYNKILIEDVEYVADKITVSKSISDFNSSGQFSAFFDNDNGDYASTFSLNDNVLIKADKDVSPATTSIFRGIIEKIEYVGKGLDEQLVISGRDYSAILQDIICSPRVFKNTETSEIIKSLLRQNVPSIMYNNVDTTSTTINKITFNGVSAFDAIRQLAEISGYYFFVDVDNDLNFKQKDNDSSGETFDNTNVTWASFSVSDEDLFNEVKVLGGRQQTFAEEEFITGTDNTGSVYELNSKPYNVKVLLSGASNITYQPGGILNITDPATENAKFLVDFNSKQVILTSGTAAGDNIVPAGSIILIDYFRSTPLIKTLRDNTSINTYGLKKKEITDKNIVDLDEATDIATTFISEHKDPVTEGQLHIRNIANLVPGQTAIINIPNHNQASETYSIINVKYNFTTQNCITDSVLSVMVNKKIQNFIDLIKEHELRLRALETAEVESSITNLETFTGSIGISGTCQIIQQSIGSAFYFNVTGHDILNSPTSLLGPLKGGSTVITL